MNDENLSNLSLQHQDVLQLKNMVRDSNDAAFLCSAINQENPNYLAIVEANDFFCEFFLQDKIDLIGKSYDFLFEEIDVSYSSQDQLEYIRLVKSIKKKEECSVVLALNNHFQNLHQVGKFKISFKPFLDDKLDKFYAIFYFEKISEELLENDDILTKKDIITSQNEALVKNLERTLSNEKLLREISYLIISDKSVKEIAYKICESLCNFLKLDRIIIQDLKEDGKKSFVVEFCSSSAKSILNDNNLEEYIKFQNEFYQKISSDSLKSKVFIANNIQDDGNFSKLRNFYEQYLIKSQIVVLTYFDNAINGGIYLNSSQNIDLTVEEIELIEIIADQLAIAIDRSCSIEKVMIANHNLLTKTLELKEAVKKEKEMRKMQTEFVALVSHEFKTPLQIIDSTRELIARKVKNLNVGDDAFEKYIDKIKSAIQRMTGLINSTLDLAKMENGKSDIVVNKEEFELHQLLQEIIERNSNLAVQKNINVRINFAGENSNIFADKKLLDHCFVNIISNAIKYSKNSTFVDVITKISEHKIAVRVVDKGIGIPKEDLEKIGQKFFRAKNTLEVSGTGIGIYLTKYFIELHNGNVKIESELNVGTAFTVILPRK